MTSTPAHGLCRLGARRLLSVYSARASSAAQANSLLGRTPQLQRSLSLSTQTRWKHEGKADQTSYKQDCHADLDSAARPYSSFQRAGATFTTQWVLTIPRSSQYPSRPHPLFSPALSFPKTASLSRTAASQIRALSSTHPKLARPFHHRPGGGSYSQSGSRGFARNLLGRLNRLPNAWMIYMLIGLNVAVFCAWQYALSSWKRFGDPAPYYFMFTNFLSGLPNLQQGRIWTLLTSCVSHEDSSHLLINMLVSCLRNSCRPVRVLIDLTPTVARPHGYSGCGPAGECSIPWALLWVRHRVCASQHGLAQVRDPLDRRKGRRSRPYRCPRSIVHSRCQRVGLRDSRHLCMPRPHGASDPFAQLVRFATDLLSFLLDQSLFILRAPHPGVALHQRRLCLGSLAGIFPSWGEDRCCRPRRRHRSRMHRWNVASWPSAAVKH